ncbi:hypothetical protein NMG60_11031273 [Bertholletia excelsa]
MVTEGVCNTGLSLGSTALAKPQKNPHPHLHQQHEKQLGSLRFDHVFPFLTLGLSSHDKSPKIDGASKLPRESAVVLHPQASSPSTVSSYSNSSMKKERDLISEEVETERVFPKVVEDHDEEGSPRKKLRLSKEQAVVLEDSFKEHSTLNPNQKQALAKQLNLRPRQVEVWFQNRRARTKLKQTEVECELLRKCCETLTDENRRLLKEIEELRALKVTAPFCMKMPAATLAICPSCERVSGRGESPSKSPFSIGGKPHFYPFSRPSAAC